MADEWDGRWGDGTVDDEIRQCLDRLGDLTGNELVAACSGWTRREVGPRLRAMLESDEVVITRWLTPRLPLYGLPTPQE